MMEDSGEVNSREISLAERNRENLSLYSGDEEMVELNRIAERAGFEVTIIPIVENGVGLGYAVFADDETAQRGIVAEAPWVSVDADDTQIKYSINKKLCWRELKENLGISSNIIQKCDKLARFEFFKDHGEVYEPELDMRLLTRAREMMGNEVPEEEIIEELEEYLQDLLDEYSSMKELKEGVEVNEQVGEIFGRTRFEVELYPDTEEVLRTMRERGGATYANVFTLTYGDGPFQFEKTLPMLKEGLVQGIFLTKAKKGPFIRQLIKQNPFKELALSYRFKKDEGQGVKPAEWMIPMIVMDDDPNQVESINNIAKEMEIPILAVFRQRSADHKRFEFETPQGEQVVELGRDENNMLTESVAALQEHLYAVAIEKVIVWNFEKWLEKLESEAMERAISTGEDVEAVIKANPRATVVDFFRDNLERVGELIEAAAMYEGGLRIIPEDVIAVKERVIVGAIELMRERYGEKIDLKGDEKG